MTWATHAIQIQPTFRVAVRPFAHWSNAITVNASVAPGMTCFHAPAICRIPSSTTTSENKDAIRMTRSAFRSRGEEKAHSRKMQAMKYSYQSTYFLGLRFVEVCGRSGGFGLAGMIFGGLNYFGSSSVCLTTRICGTQTFV